MLTIVKILPDANEFIMPVIFLIKFNESLSLVNHFSWGNFEFSLAASMVGLIFV